MADADIQITAAVIKQLLNDIYSGKDPDKKRLFRETFKKLASGVTKGYGKDFPNIKYNTPDFIMLNNLQYNVGVFSVFKNHNYIAETVKLLKNDDGSLRSKKEFIKEALKLDKTYNKRYLATEYDQAISAARMARKWEDIERTRDLYPNLMYVAVMDARTRELHKKWHGIILPIDHKFWNNHYPPNDWGCRCTVRRTDKPIDDKDVDVDKLPDLPKQFNTNVGKTAKVFDDSHPYFKIPGYTQVAKLALNGLLRYQTQSLYPILKDSFKTKITTEIGKITVPNKALKEALNQPHAQGYLKNNLLLKLKDILKDAFYVGSAEPIKNSIHWKQYHYLRLKDYDNMIVVLREDRKENLFFYSIVDTKKAKL